MRFRDESLLLGVTASLALTVALLVVHTGPRAPSEPLARTPGVVHGVASGEDSVVELDDAAETRPSVRSRGGSAEDGEVDPFVGDERRREGRRREAACLAEFLALREEQGSDALERAAREVLASHSEPLARRIAALRALHTSGAPDLNAALVAAVEGELDVSDGSSESLPRCAVKLLFERAPSDEAARSALARIAFVPGGRVSEDVRRSASTALAASLPGASRGEVERLLRREVDSLHLDAALLALARDARFVAGEGGVVVRR